MTRPVVVLPLPDSPTSARTSPRWSVRSIPSTARTTSADAADERIDEPAADREMDLEALELGAASSSISPTPTAVGADRVGRRGIGDRPSVVALVVQVAGDADAVERQLGRDHLGADRPWPRSSAARTGSPAAGRAGPAASPG